MIITNAQVQMQSAYSFHQQQSEQIEVEVRQASQNNTQDLSNIANISQQALHDLQSHPIQASSDVEVNPLDELSLQVSILKQLVEYFTGKKLVFADLSSYSESSHNKIQENSMNQRSLNLEASVRVDIQRHYEEREVSTFNTQAFINTSDGRQIEIDLSLTQSRSFSTDEHLSIRTGEFKDPLVLNFDQAVELSSDRFEFDIDADGVDDSVPILSSDSAYLALDKNNDGKINDGSELFGTRNGDGFADLSIYDEDKNGWIDEADAIFSQLKLWSKTSETELFVNVTNKNVGAIYLGNIETPFSLVDSSNQNILGQSKNTGFYLTETGDAKTIQQIDVST